MSKYSFFISYSRYDSEIADDLVAKLENRGFKVWIDRTGIESGDAFKKKIVSAIQDSDTVLFISSIHSNSSSWTAKEIGVAIYEGKKIVPIKIDNTRYNSEILFDLINLDYIDFVKYNSIDDIVARLLSSLTSPEISTSNNIQEAQRVPNEKHRKIIIPKVKLFSGINDKHKSRNRFINIILYLLLILSGLAILGLLPGCIWSLQLMDSPEDGFARAYHKGFIPAFILCMGLFIGTLEILKWKKEGFSIIVICVALVNIPLMWNEFEEFVYFSVFSMIGLLVFGSILMIRRNNKSLWYLLKAESKNLIVVRNILSIIWVFLLLFFPIFMAWVTGFRGDYYSNGMKIIDARLNSSAYYTLVLYRTVLFDDNYKEKHAGIRKLKAQEWANYAVNNKNWRDGLKSDFDDYNTRFLEELLFIYKNKGIEDAKEFLDKNKMIGVPSDINKYLDFIDDKAEAVGFYEYFKPYRERIIRLLIKDYEYTATNVEDADE